MPLKAFAFTAQQQLQSRTGHPFRRSHLYELLAASFGLHSHAALIAQGFVTDAGIGPVHPAVSPVLLERLSQLGYPSTLQQAAASTLVELASHTQLGFIHLEQLQQVATPDSSPSRDADEDDDWDDWEEGDDDHPDHTTAASPSEPLPSLEQLRNSRLLMTALEQAADAPQAEAHFVLAALHRCKKPNSYLYDESRKGRALSVIEQRWADAYPAEKARFDRYTHHLRCAAALGSRQAALESAVVFDDPGFYRLAEQGSGPIDAWGMINAAPSEQDRHHWLRIAAEQGSWQAIEELAWAGDPWALRQMAEGGDIDAMRTLAEAALAGNDLEQAWLWQHLALLLDEDLTRSTLRAYHDGGLYAGQDYDDDYGGPLYVDGDEGLDLPPLDLQADQRAREQAASLFSSLQAD
jgi:hypothetical protein